MLYFFVKNEFSNKQLYNYYYIMSTFEVQKPLFVEDVIELQKNNDNKTTYIDYEKTRPRVSAETGMSFYTMLIKNEGRFMRAKLTFGPTSIVNGPWADRKFISASIQINTDNGIGKALYNIAKRFEKDYNDGKLNIKGKKPRNLSLPIWDGNEEKKAENPKVKIALNFKQDLSSKFTCNRNILVNGELESKIIECNSKNCHDIFKYGTVIAGDVLVTYNIHPSRGLSLCFEAYILTVKQTQRSTQVVNNLTRAQMLEMVDSNEEEEKKDDTIEDQLNKLELLE